MICKTMKTWNNFYLKNDAMLITVPYVYVDIEKFSKLFKKYLLQWFNFLMQRGEEGGKL